MAEPSREEIEALPGPTLLEFGTSWCGHCRRALPLIAHALGIPKKDQFLTGKNPNVPDFKRYVAPDGKHWDLNFIGAGHHIGTHRMGTTKSNSVVNRDQRSWDHENLYVVGCGSFPTTGTANPTLTAVALALRSVKDMLTQLR